MVERGDHDGRRFTEAPVVNFTKKIRATTERRTRHDHLNERRGVGCLLVCLVLLSSLFVNLGILVRCRRLVCCVVVAHLVFLVVLLESGSLLLLSEELINRAVKPLHYGANQMLDYCFSVSALL